MNKTWIDAEDKMPEKEGHYLLFADGGGFQTDYSVCYFDGRDWEDDFHSWNIFWMPLPPEPES